MLLLPPQFLSRQPSLVLHSTFHISVYMQHVFHYLLATMEIILSSKQLYSTFSCQLAILTEPGLTSEVLSQLRGWSCVCSKELLSFRGTAITWRIRKNTGMGGLWFFCTCYNLPINPESLPFSVYLTKLQSFCISNALSEQ